MPDYENLRAHDTRWTPLTDELRDWIDALGREAGTWRAVSQATGIKVRYIRRLRQRKPTVVTVPLKCVSLVTLDKLFTPSERGNRINQLPWYTVEEIQEMGLWDQPLPHIERKGSE